MVVKCAATREVNGRQVIIRNAQELFEFCLEKLTVENSQTNKALLNRIFYFVSTNELDEYRLQAPNEKHSTVKGTRKIHQIFNGFVTEKGFYHRMFSCLCEKCLNGMYAECQQLITRKWHNFSTESSNEDPLSDSDESNDDEMYFTETEASLLRLMI